MDTNKLEQILRWVNSPFLHIGQTPVTLGGVASAVVVVMVAFFVSAFVQKVLLVPVKQKLKLTSGMTYALSRFLHYGIVFLGVMMASQCVGLNFGSLAVVFGFLSVGIGFGLQNVTSNFISGLILLLEQPISVGDFISVEGRMGRVAQINMRSSVIETPDNISIIVPNSRLIENHVINWSHTNPEVRIHNTIGVAYGSNVELVKKSLLEAADTVPGILKRPEARVRLISFGDSALEFDLLSWTNDPENQFHLQSELNYKIEAVFRRETIEIPFPQQDVHLQVSPALDLLKNNGTVS